MDILAVLQMSTALLGLVQTAMNNGQTTIDNESIEDIVKRRNAALAQLDADIAATPDAPPKP